MEPKQRKPRCIHSHTVESTTGGMHLSGGEVWDDIKTTIVCLDCGKEVKQRKHRAFGRNRIKLLL